MFNGYIPLLYIYKIHLDFFISSSFHSSTSHLIIFISCFIHNNNVSLSTFFPILSIHYYSLFSYSSFSYIHDFLPFIITIHIFSVIFLSYLWYSSNHKNVPYFAFILFILANLLWFIIISLRNHFRTFPSHLLTVFLTNFDLHFFLIFLFLTLPNTTHPTPLHPGLLKQHGPPPLYVLPTVSIQCLSER